MCRFHRKRLNKSHKRASTRSIKYVRLPSDFLLKLLFYICPCEGERGIAGWFWCMTAVLRIDSVRVAGVRSFEIPFAFLFQTPPGEKRDRLWDSDPEI